MALVKTITVAHAGKHFRNGNKEFDLTEADMDELIRNFEEQGRQVPVYLGGEHFANRADRPADGWVQGLRRVDKDLVAVIKLHGAGEDAVTGDEFRGISIRTVLARDLRGRPIGQVLDHMLITNQPFFADLNIAASRRPTAAEEVTYISMPTKSGGEVAGLGLTKAETGEMEQLRTDFLAGRLAPKKEPRFILLMDRSVAAMRGAA